MGEAHPDRIIRQLVGQFPVVEEAAVIGALPGTQVHLVDRHGGVLPVPVLASFHPIGILPGVGRGVLHAGRGAGTQFVGSAIGIGLEEDGAGVPVPDLEFVEGAGTQARNEQFPDAMAGVDPHGVAAAVPMVEVPHHAHPFGVGGPDGEQDARDAVSQMFPGPQEAVGVPVLAFPEEVEVEVRKLGAEGVGIVDPALHAILDPAQFVMRFKAAGKSLPHEEVRALDAGEGLSRIRQVCGLGPGQEGPDHRLRPGAVASQHPERVVVTRLQQLSQVFVQRLGLRHGPPLLAGYPNLALGFQFDAVAGDLQEVQIRQAHHHAHGPSFEGQDQTAVAAGRPAPAGWPGWAGLRPPGSFRGGS